jgi:hypothetical protein
MHCKSVLAFTAFALIASQATAAEQAGQSSAKSRGQSQGKNYCVQFEPETGTRIHRTECRTKQEWARRGVDIDELIKK